MNQWKWKTTETRFWEKVDKSSGHGPKGDCWIWTGGKRGSKVAQDSTSCYGGFRFRGKVWLAHRVAYVLVNGDIANDIGVLHRCDNPGCVNPAHLFLGAQLDNMRDCKTKGRMKFPPIRVGKQRWNSKLTNSRVRQIRKSYENGKTQYELADSFGVSQTTISHILLGKVWRHA